jgi:hypothetical protein
MIPHFKQNIKGLFAKKLKKMEMEKIYSDFIVTDNPSRSRVLIAEEMYQGTEFAGCV